MLCNGIASFFSVLHLRCAVTAVKKISHSQAHIYVRWRAAEQCRKHTRLNDRQWLAVVTGRCCYVLTLPTCCISHRATRWASASKATSDEKFCRALGIAIEGTCGTYCISYIRILTYPILWYVKDTLPNFNHNKWLNGKTTQAHRELAVFRARLANSIKLRLVFDWLADSSHASQWKKDKIISSR